ncbi:MAG: gluconate 2-dehydrogenase subunit 3 family protein [Gemmatimonadota bacterium]
MTDSSKFSRREVVTGLAATAGAFLMPSAARATEAAKVSTAARGAAGAVGTAYAPKIYTAHEYATVRALVDEVIPKDAKSGSATDAGVPEFMDTMLDLEPNMRVAHRGGLAWLDHECRRRYAKDFVTCTTAERHAVLDDIAYPAKAKPEFAAGVNWFNSFRDFTATGFFTSEMGVTDIGYMGNTPVMNWDGCPPENYTRLGTQKP